MSTYSNRLQPALLNLLQCVVRFFYPRSSCMVHISVDVFGGRKSLVKPMTWQKPAIILSCSVLPPEIVIHDDAYISGRSENNIKCIVHDDLGWRNQTTRYILSCYWLYEWFSQFHSCGTYSVLSRSHSISTGQSDHLWLFGLALSDVRRTVSTRADSSYKCFFRQLHVSVHSRLWITDRFIFKPLASNPDFHCIIFSRTLPCFLPSRSGLLSLSILTAILPGEPGLASFTEAKDDGSGGDNWSYKTCTKLQSNHHQQQTNTQLF